jgi:DNA-binding response OmpR family regulator
MKSILILEDDLSLAKTLSNILLKDIHLVKVAHSLEKAYSYLEKNNPDLVIADRVLPDGDGIELVKFLHNSSFKTKILILSTKNEIKNRVEGLQGGADDYLSKPFSTTELLLRVNSLLNKKKITSTNCLKFGPIKLHADDGIVELGGKKIKLRKKESEILNCLFTHQNQVVSRQKITNWAWGCSSEIPSHATIDVYIRRLRIILAKHAPIIQTVRGFGYKAILPAKL